MLVTVEDGDRGSLAGAPLPLPMVKDEYDVAARTATPDALNVTAAWAAPLTLYRSSYATMGAPPSLGGVQRIAMVVSVAVPVCRSRMSPGTVRVVMLNGAVARGPYPTPFRARTWIACTVVPGESASLAGEPAPEPMAKLRAVEVAWAWANEPTVYRTSYSVTLSPPFDTGGLQDKVTEDPVRGPAVRPMTGPGTSRVVADRTTPLSAPTPRLLTARTEMLEIAAPRDSTRRGLPALEPRTKKWEELPVATEY
mmetsp:Transcript_16962/g.39988  ORF Transcript_16962/g.39988 Transcript_16962/m.39988 type:complete len:253 (+) Transcript_16962:3753-4511(+)